MKTRDRGMKKEVPRLLATSKKHSFVEQDESADRVIRCLTELYLLYGTFMAPIKIRSALPVGHYGGGREYFERSMKPILLERDNNLIDARRSLSQVGTDSLTRGTMQIALIVIAIMMRGRHSRCIERDV